MRPLDDVRVVEIGQGIAGPYCALLLADLGADVIKVEHPEGGDELRQQAPLSKGFSETFAALNRNKRSVALDLESAWGKGAIRQLIFLADVVIDSLPPGRLAKADLDYESVSPEKPALVYCSISPFGQSGPRAQEEGADLLVQALSGMMSVTGEPEARPSVFGGPLSELAAGLYGACGIQAAIHAVRRGAPGQHLDVSLLGASLGLGSLKASEYFCTGRDPERLGSADPWQGPHQSFRAADGWFVLSAADDRHWHALCQVVGRPELFSDPRFTTAADRAEKREVLQLLLEACFVEQPCEAWLDELSQRGVPCMAVNGLSQALNEPQVQHLGLVDQVTLPSGVTTRTIASPFGISGEGPRVRRPPPELGEHTREILSSLGIPTRQPQ